MKDKFWLKVVALVVIILSGIGVIPRFFGLAGDVVLNELNKIPVANVASPGISAKVTRVVDGDTIEIVFAAPPNEVEVLRLLGVDTPETVHPRLPVQFYGPEATQFTKNLCDHSIVKLHFQNKVPERGNYGRLLVYVELSNGDILNEQIISNGFGYSYRKYPHRDTDKYNVLENEARSAKRGLWGAVKKSDLPVWLLEAEPDILSP